jgi:hypothetical protein
MKRFLCAIMVFSAALCLHAADKTLNTCIEESAATICKNLPRGTRIAIVEFKSEADSVSDYIMEELTYAFTAGSVEVADRTNCPMSARSCN